MKIEPLVINHATGDSGDYIDVVSGHTFGPKGGVSRAQLHKRIILAHPRQIIIITKCQGGVRAYMFQR